MVALADGVADYVGGAGRSFRSGVKYSVDFQTEAPADIVARRGEFDRMSGVKALAYEAGAIVGGFLDIITFGHFERKSYGELVHGGSDWYDIDLSGYETAGERVDAMFKAYEASGGKFDEEDGQGNREGNDLERSVGGSENVGRERSNGNGYDTGEKDSDSGYDAGNKEVDTRQHDVKKAKKEAYGMARNFRKRAESDVYDVANANFDFDFDTDFNNDWKEYDSIARRVKTQQRAFAGHINKVSGLKLDALKEHIREGFVSTLGIPYVRGEDGERIPGKGRDFTEDEVMVLVNRAYNTGD